MPTGEKSEGLVFLFLSGGKMVYVKETKRECRNQIVGSTYVWFYKTCCSGIGGLNHRINTN